MKNWHETQVIFDHTRQRLASGESVALAVVFAIKGSTYRRPGAKLLITADGDMIGNVSGGCLEQDVRETALDVLRTGSHRVLHYDTGADEDTMWGMGLGCNGLVDIVVLRLSPESDGAMVNAAHAALAGDQDIVLAYGVSGPDAGRCSLNPSKSVTTAPPGEWFCEPLIPPPECWICGAGDDAIPLAQMAAQVGFRVVVADHRAAYCSRTRFPDARRLVIMRPDEESPAWHVSQHAVAVVMTHALQHDTQWVCRWMHTDVPYVGLLGPRERRDEIRKGIDPRNRERLYGPVGLDMGGEGAEQVALSIVAEALAVWNGRAGGFLRERDKAIHANA